MLRKGIQSAASRSFRAAAVSTRLYSSDATNEFLALLQKKGITRRGSSETELSPAEFDKLLASDKELQESFSRVESQVQRELSGLRARERAPIKEPVRVAVTGAAGSIGYAALFRIASGEMLGPDQPVILHLLELPGAKKALDGVVMELQDCAFPLLSGVVATDDTNQAFDGVDYALLIGAKPRSKGMQRADLLKENAAIFKTQGAALNKNANRDTLRVVVVGNPANTNAWIAAQSAPDISPTQFTALTKLDHNRGIAQLALKTGARVPDIERFCIWGNHSSTQVPDINNAQINDTWARDVVKDKKWIDSTFIPTVQERGAAIIAARGASSAASAANATIQHMREWTLGTGGEWTSMGVWSDGSYGAEEGVYYSFPVVCSNGSYTIVQNVPVDPATAKKMELSNQELIQERDTVAGVLGIKQKGVKENFQKWKTEFEKEGKLPHFHPPTL